MPVYTDVSQVSEPIKPTTSVAGHEREFVDALCPPFGDINERVA
jgi:hypothetical protein